MMMKENKDLHVTHVIALMLSVITVVVALPVVVPVLLLLTLHPPILIGSIKKKSLKMVFTLLNANSTRPNYNVRDYVDF